MKNIFHYKKIIAIMLIVMFVIAQPHVSTFAKNDDKTENTTNIEEVVTVDETDEADIKASVVENTRVEETNDTQNAKKNLNMTVKALSNIPIQVSTSEDVILKLSKNDTDYELTVYENGILTNTHKTGTDIPNVVISSAKSVTVQWIGSSAMTEPLSIQLNSDIDTSSSDNIAAFSIDKDYPANVELSTNGAITLKSGLNRAGIEVPKGASISLTSGTFTVSGGQGAAGIGGSYSDGGYEGNAGTISFDGAIVTAKAGKGGAGIGGGKAGNGGTTTINSGTIISEGNERDTRDYRSGGGAGIGGGGSRLENKVRGTGGNGGNITINGGNVTAWGWSPEIVSTATGGAGIGGGYMADGGNITINGGTIATIGNGGGAGIGGGKGGNGGTITITKGTITATGKASSASGIGGGAYADYADPNDRRGHGGDITISGGEIIAQGSYQAASIGGGGSGDSGNILITGGKITAGNSEGSRSPGIGIGSGSFIYTGYYQYVNSITISGTAEVFAYGTYGSPGIGGGEEDFYATRDTSKTGVITISGKAKVTAIGGNGGTSTGNAAGIGGGSYYSGLTINISEEAVVNSTGSVKGAGIGGGNSSTDIEVNISGNANVTATGDGYSAGIGGGALSERITIAISGNPVVMAKGGTSTFAAAGIGGGNTNKDVAINISGGYITSTGAGAMAHDIGKGSTSGTASLTITGGSVVPTRVTTNSNISTYMAVDSTNGPWPVAIAKSRGSKTLTGGLKVNVPLSSGSYEAYTINENEHGDDYQYAALLWLPTDDYENIQVGSYENAYADVMKRIPNVTTFENILYWTNSLTYAPGITDIVENMPDPLTSAEKPISIIISALVPTSEGRSFLGWKSSIDGLIYQANTTFTMPEEDVTLTGQWSYRLIYKSDDHDSGTVPVDTTHFTNSNKNAVIADNSGNLTREGYILSGWTLNADDSNQIYKTGDSLVITEDTILYAYWEPKSDITYKVEYYLEIDKGSYELKETNSFLGTTGSVVNAVIKTYEGYTYNSSSQHSLISGVVLPDGSLTLKVYYDKNKPTPGEKGDGGIETGDSINTMMYINVIGILSMLLLITITLKQRKKKLNN